MALFIVTNIDIFWEGRCEKQNEWTDTLKMRKADKKYQIRVFLPYFKYGKMDMTKIWKKYRMAK